MVDMGSGKKKLTGTLLAVGLAVSFLAGCNQKTEETQIQATKVQTTAAARGNLEITGSYVGTVEPHTSVSVTPLVAGTVKTVHVKAGDTVKEGDVLCEFDDKTAQLGLESAENALASAKAGKKAAQEQIDAAKKQADASIKSMKSQLKTLKKQRKSSKKQLKKLNKNLEKLKKAQEAAGEGYQTVKKIYDTANTLYIQYQAFLSANPDCQTTAGLSAAALTPVSPAASSKKYTENFSIETESSAQAAAETDNAAQGEVPGNDNDTDTNEKESENTNVQPSEAEIQKQQTAAALLNALTEIPLTVEYLSQAGLDTLKDQVSQAQAASAAASSGYAEAATAKQTLKSGIASMDAQIKTLKDNIKTAEDAASDKTSTDVYDTQIKAAKTGVESAQYQKDLYTVTAPISGVIESVNVSENEIAAQGYPAFTIADKEAILVSFYVPAQVQSYLRMGDAVSVEGPTGEVKGEVSSIAEAVDPQKGLFKVQVQVTSKEAKTFLSGSSVSLSMVTNSVKGQIVIPFDAVYYDNDQTYVYLARDGQAWRQDITAGPYNNEKIVVLDGLSGGEEVITTWGAGLKDGAAIEIITEENTP